MRSTSRLGCQSTIAKDGVIEVEITRESLEAFENEHPEARGKYTKRAGPAAVATPATTAPVDPDHRPGH